MKAFGDTSVIPEFLATAVGSMPHTNAADAVNLVLESLRTAPHPPQLSRLDPREQMWIQFTEGLPRFRVDLENLSYHFDTSGDPVPEVEEFFMSYFEVMEGGTSDRFRIGEDYGRGIHLLLEQLGGGKARQPFIKAHVTGPMSFGLTVTDGNKKPIFYDPLFRDVAVKGMGLKAAWLIEQFKPHADNIIIFFDEPSMSAYGSSAYLGVSKEDVVESLDEVISMAAAKGAIAGVHCCGNTDWGILMETSTRIINFDAVDYMDTMPIYAPALTRFLERGGVLAWGAVPNDERVMGETKETILNRVKVGIRMLEEAKVDRDLLTQRLMITPACGCAGLTVEQTEMVYRLLSELDAERNPEFD
jgi:hypothetical protein